MSMDKITNKYYYKDNIIKVIANPSIPKINEILK